MTDDVVLRLTRDALDEWLARLLDAGTRILAPVNDDGVLLFDSISSPSDAVLEPSGKTRWSPKEHLLPRTETLHRYTFDGAGIQVDDPPADDCEQVLLGVRCCDAAGLDRLDDLFLSGEPDPFYVDRRRRTTVVTAACAAADPACFCTAVGGSPAAVESSDLQLVPVDGDWLLRIVTEKGRTLVGGAADRWPAAAADDIGRIADLEREVAEQVRCPPLPDDLSRLLEGGFDHNVWEDVARCCMACGVCASVCPSCSCFDMHHGADAWRGEQCRVWDSCAFALFTLHASGHNPRSEQAQRYRQRILHKFAFRREARAPFRCVGCGRCTTLCPAGLDVVDALIRAVAAIRGEMDDAC